jgi:hypothetical protein
MTEGSAVKKLTLSADEDVIRDAKRLARRNKTSVSAMFSRFVRGMAKPKKARMEIPPDSIVARATGFISLPKGKTPRDVLTEALMEKYGIKK